MLIDIVFGAIIFISAIISFFRGFIRECLTIIGVVGGVLAAISFGPALRPTFEKWFGVEEGEDVAKLFDLIPMDIIANVCAYASIFIVVVIMLSVISHFMAGAVKAAGLGPIDRTLGVIFGILRAVILLGLAYYPFHIYMEQESKDKFFEASKTHFVVEKTAQVMSKFLPKPDPEEVDKKIDEATEAVKEKTGEAAKGSIKEQLIDKDILFSEGRKKQKADKLNEGEEGYDEEQREEMNDLMRQPLE